MTLEELRGKVREWDRVIGSPDEAAHYGTILGQLDYHAANEWRVYLPAEHPDFSSSYMERLAAWIGNAPDEDDQKVLLEYALYVSFFSHEDFVALYRSAFEREIMRWVAAQIGARLEPAGAQAFQDNIRQAIHQRTWFCPVTDSMDINEFFKVNHLTGVGHRPGFATLQMLAEDAHTPDPQLATNVIHYMGDPGLNGRRPPLQRIVLLEDIVGSGSQCRDAIRWAVRSLGKPVLFVPLILCPNGAEALRTEVQQSGGLLTVRPVLELRRSDLLGPERQAQPGWPMAEKLENLASRCAATALANCPAFGYEQTGCSLATFSNTPDNTLPIVHQKPQTGGWEPLFPRVYRD